MTEKVPEEQLLAERGRAYASRIRTAQTEVRRVMVEQDRLVEDVFACLLTGGHALLEGVPGLGKTLLIRSVARVIDLENNRIQFTPDLMPADIIGTDTLVQDERGGQEIRFRPGPVFTNVLLADEINRATPKTQSALLEAMEERSVTTGGKTHRLDEPFIVLATQNPIELEGTYPLPEAQLDRFFFHLRVPFPSRRGMLEILTRTTGTVVESPESVLSGADIIEMRSFVRGIIAGETILNYATSLVLATHPGDSTAPERVRAYLRYGASPRAAQALILAGKVYAFLDGRFHVSAEDIRRAAPPALRHRIVPGFRAEAEGVSTDDIIDDILRKVSHP